MDEQQAGCRRRTVEQAFVPQQQACAVAKPAVEQHIRLFDHAHGLALLNLPRRFRPKQA